MIGSIVAICIAADVTGLPVNKCYMNPGEKFQSHELCEAWAYRMEKTLFINLTNEYNLPVVVTIVCRAEKTGT
jgi:hypothetical protein